MFSYNFPLFLHTGIFFLFLVFEKYNPAITKKKNVSCGASVVFFLVTRYVVCVIYLVIFNR